MGFAGSFGGVRIGELPLAYVGCIRGATQPVKPSFPARSSYVIWGIDFTILEILAYRLHVRMCDSRMHRPKAQREGHCEKAEWTCLELVSTS